MRHRFQAHENAIKCLAIDPHEEHFVTGSADGDIRVSTIAFSIDPTINVGCIRLICASIYFCRYGVCRFTHHCIRSLVSMQRAAFSSTLARVLHKFKSMHKDVYFRVVPTVAWKYVNYPIANQSSKLCTKFIEYKNIYTQKKSIHATSNEIESNGMRCKRCGVKKNLLKILAC